jgi:hypothetical protein
MSPIDGPRDTRTPNPETPDAQASATAVDTPPAAMPTTLNGGNGDARAPGDVDEVTEDDEPVVLAAPAGDGPGEPDDVAALASPAGPTFDDPADDPLDADELMVSSDPADELTVAAEPTSSDPAGEATVAALLGDEAAPGHPTPGEGSAALGVGVGIDDGFDDTGEDEPLVSPAAGATVMAGTGPVPATTPARSEAYVTGPRPVVRTAAPAAAPAPTRTRAGQAPSRGRVGVLVGLAWVVALAGGLLVGALIGDDEPSSPETSVSGDADAWRAVPAPQTASTQESVPTTEPGDRPDRPDRPTTTGTTEVTLPAESTTSTTDRPTRSTTSTTAPDETTSTTAPDETTTTTAPDETTTTTAPDETTTTTSSGP